jgi:IPT/TIG domain-containing protein
LRTCVSFSILTALLAAACGGGTTTQILPNATPAPTSAATPDFSIAISPATLNLTQGGIPQSVTISITPKNSFSGTVAVAISGLPPGVATNPASPLQIAPSASPSATILVGASIATATGSATIAAQATSGTLSHTASLALTIEPSILASLPRSTYARTDSTPLANDPAGEPHHRHIVYDTANKHIFIANRAMNCVDVFATSNQPPSNGIATHVARIDVPGASSADISADGTTIWIGTVTQQAVAIDTTTLQVKARYAISPQIVPTATFDRPEELIALGSGNFLVRLRQSSATQSMLMLWNPAASKLTSLDSVVPNGLGPVARTADHSKALVAAGDASGQVTLLDSSGNVIAGPVTAAQGTVTSVAANPDGSGFAAAVTTSSATQVVLLNAQLNPVETQATATLSGLAFSRDGNFLYASRSASTFPAVQVLDGHTLKPVGDVSDLSVQGVQSEIEEADETGLLFGVANRGVSFIDASKPATLPANVPSFAFPPAAQPSVGSASGGTPIALAGQNLESSAVVVFGGQPANDASVANGNLIQLRVPANVATGAVNIAAYFPSGWIAIAPDGFSYGPQILKTLPNAGNGSGGDIVKIYGYGFGSDANPPTVTIGGASATIQKIENLGTVEPPLGLDTSFPFALQSITVQTPPGTAGAADIVVSSASGNATVTRGFQFTQSVQTTAGPHLYKFPLYDRRRQLVFASYDAGVDAFPLPGATAYSGSTSLFCPSLKEAGPCPDADIRGIALSPDGSQLITADFGSQNIFLIDPDVPGDISWVPLNMPAFGPARVTATSNQTVFVSLQNIASSPGPCNGCLVQFDMSARTIAGAPESQVAAMTTTPLLQSDTAGDRIFTAFQANAANTEALWSASNAASFASSPVNEAITDIAASGDGTMFATSANNISGGVSPSASGASGLEIRDTSLNLMSARSTPELEQFAAGTNAPGIAMHPSGALTYQPYLDGPAPPENPNGAVPPLLHGGIDIFDSHTGQLKWRVALPEPLATDSSDVDALHAQYLAIDETGQRLFAIMKSGLTVVQLASLPLAIGTLSPNNIAASGGTVVTVRGSGFVSGITSTIGGKSAAVAFTDASTISITTPAIASGTQRLTLTNPSGETASLDAAFTAN